MSERFEQLPEEIIDAISGLDNEHRRVITMSLLQKGELSFANLLKITKLSKQDLSFHLRKLIASTFVQHYYRDHIGNEQYSFYALTSFGERFLDTIIRSLLPSDLQPRTTQTETTEVRIPIGKETKITVRLAETTSEPSREEVRINEVQQ